MYGASIVRGTASVVNVCSEKVVNGHLKGSDRGRFKCYQGIFVAILTF